ncbi:GNAT family N-acetyltransferase [Dyadobacter subterraneus]|uniref:GNAT family N-acetyltransferase n=1 Tax=Dyadobacter subterraneus TaxID=2773304 RepID=A0ABR9WBH8_9BACT|nr:GNAT family N-acetyltransferase [Dyadobacter subterraneus]MBE9462840.1 GNAT family N-acetyltransferase [Dyadobacter subterraneus]
MLIEQCTNHHLSRLAEIFNDYRIHFGQESDLVGSNAFLEERLLKNQAVVFVAIDEESDEYMGFTLLYPMYTSLKIKSTWTLNDMFIAEKYRKFGVASKLLEKVKEFGSETDAQWISLKTGIENLKAQALYEKFGFVKDEGHFYYYLQ